MGYSYSHKNPSQPFDQTASDQSAETWITDRAWVCGSVGAVSVIVCAIWFNATEALAKGVVVMGHQLTQTPVQTLLSALLITTGAMLLTEVIRLYLRNPRNFIAVSPLLKSGRYVTFMATALGNYLAYLGLFWLVVVFFQWAGEYGYQRNAPYYQPWFTFLDLAFSAYLWGGLPYVCLTRALKHDPQADDNDPPILVAKLFTAIKSFLLREKKTVTAAEQRHKKAIRALLVKLFFAPLMTVFFFDQFPHLVNNVDYLLNTIPALIADQRYTHQQFNTDFFNLSITLIFSIDIALAWCGYVVSSRWVDNRTHSAEPTLLGWVVCLCCYPPFQMFLGLYFAAPGEREVLRFDNQWLITAFTGMMVLSYLVYMASTLWFGVRFSNLTHRGIIRTGPYAIVRHPAYASKNFAWWCVMFPAILYNVVYTGIHIAIAQTLGLLIMTGFYYLRATTEERHLSADPRYRSYCQTVKYRFIPGVL
ncbi:hypothetical protein FKG94_21045 [Exilibacterium tricleocarpae]|uniref:DUF1295 domain-containing protein n=1 Tax=Exilibacterium tricleocarpae TaxID=2591008 RepID=A0A545SZX0_9GAMM|nr:isoprenylcysteine carboxylmethyltransferase family protein [Exilibacterium tricleocarpae]TQV70512.1 hypothetical protein FKG94_21045 [Exilibacterium tricleocarpae]